MSLCRFTARLADAFGPAPMGLTPLPVAWQALDRTAPVLPMMPGSQSGAPTTMCVTASPPCLPR